MKLSVELEKWRADRPDEWKMDEFIRNAAKIESENDALSQKLRAAQHEVEALATQVDELTICFNERTAVYWQAVDANSLQAKRIDELAATVEALRGAYNELSKNGGTLYRFKEIFEATPQQHLRDVREEAGRAGFIACYEQNKVSILYSENIERRADNYAESVRGGEK